MRRVVGVVVWLLVLFGVMLWPAVTYNVSSGSSTYEETTIKDYEADFTISSNGDLHAVETLTVTFPNYGKHGIFRFFDEADQSAPHARRVPHDITVTMDGSPEPFEVQSAQNGRFTNAKIGSADTTVDPGDHTYVIGYDIDGVLEPGTTGQPTQLYWNLIPGGWLQSITKAHLVVHLPVAANGVQCARGAGQSGGCQAQGDGTRTLTVDVDSLSDHTPITIKAGLDMATPAAGTSVPWTARWDPILGRSPLLVGLVVLLALLAGGLGYSQARRVKEKPPGYPLMYAPPDGVGPAQGAYILTEKTDDRQFVASIMQAAEHGSVKLDRPDDKTWTVTDTSGPQGWAGLDSVTQRVARLPGGAGQSFTASSKSVTAGEFLRDELTGFQAATRSWAREAGLMQASGLGCLAGLMVIGGGILALGIAGGNLFDMSLVALIPAALAGMAAPVLGTGASTRRTATGRELWSRVGGFRRVLSTPSSESRFDFSGRKDLYTQYIPWAVAFDCADEWAKKYRVETGEEPPVPAYFPGYAGSHAGNYTDQMVNSFSSTVSSAISAYNATQTSSSGGGGGFSGGGGGGGGGGGSW
jgi:hypothetical protein